MNLKFEPKTYTVYRAHQPLKIDGNLDKKEWSSVHWTEYFGAITGGSRYFEDKPSRVKMLWDDEYLYVAAELKEPDLWATMTERNSPLYNDNAFEIFIDPDGDTHNYFEFECNALGTIWDIYLNKPYRDGGIILSDWNLLTEQETADEMGLSKATVHEHAGRVYKHFGVTSRAELLSRFIGRAAPGRGGGS